MGKTSTIIFFATAEDLRPVLANAESKLNVKYCQCGLFDDETPAEVSSLVSLNTISIAEIGDVNFVPTYLVLRTSAVVNVRRVPQRRGGMKFAVDQKANPGSTTIRPGGMFGTTAVIEGMLGTVKDDPVAREIHNVFANELRKRFVKIRGNLVGDKALQLLKEGVRLAHAVHMPKEFDLKLDPRPHAEPANR